MARHAVDDDATAAAQREPVEMSAEDEEAIRAKLREAGWDKKKLLATKGKDAGAAASATAKETADEKKEPKDDAKERERPRDKEREGRSGRGSRRSRSARRRDRDRGSRRDRERGSRRSRRSSRSVSKSRSRSASMRGSRRRDKDRGRGRANKRRSRSVSVSRSRSPSKSRGSKRSRRGDESPAAKKESKKTDGDASSEKPKEKEKQPDDGHKKDESSPTNKPTDEKTNGNERDDKDESSRKAHKSSRHRSRSTSRSPSRSRRHRRRHRSPSRSRSPSRGRRSRSRSRRRRSSRRRSRSRSRSYSRHRRRSKSRERSRRDANSSPEPHQFPPPAAAPVVPAVANPLNPTITQLMQQYPTMSLQDIIAKMQASNVTMAAAVSMKPARELYVGNLPPSVTGPQLQEFLGTIIQQVGLTVQPGNPILSTWISTDGHFAFCEMRSIEECNMALMLNQLPLLGQPLKFGRPKSFMGPPQPMPVLPPRTQTALSNLGCTPNTAWFASSAGDLSVAAMTASLTATPGLAPMPTSLVAPFTAPVAAVPVVAGPISSNKLVMSNIPVVLTEDQVKELVEPFGALKHFEFVKDPVMHQPTGSALFEYEDESVTDDAKNGLDGLDLGGIPLAVRRATAGEETGPALRMANMVSIDELKDDEEFADLKEDVEEECKRFGTVVTLEIPRPVDGEVVPGLGDIFVQFGNNSEAAAALKALSGRKFGGNIVKVSYFPLSKLQQKNFA